jgi:L-ascorbate metabolism protein UlaG (beta-lactamase superfamily)
MVKDASIQHIRNATLLINYNGKKILVDPMFFHKGALDPFAGKERNPMVELPMSIVEITKDIDMVLVTHTHPDHFDPIASETLNKSIKLFNQPADKDYFIKAGFTNAESIDVQTVWNGISIYRTDGKHGSGEVLNHMGTVSGFVLKAEDQPTIYIVGDSIWNEEVNVAIQKFEPDIIIVNSGGAIWPGFETTPILMTEEQVISVLKASNKAKVIAVHMEALDHCHTTRATLKQAVEAANIGMERLIIPNDGELVIL